MSDTPMMWPRSDECLIITQASIMSTKTEKKRTKQKTTMKVDEVIKQNWLDNKHKLKRQDPRKLMEEQSKV